MPNYGQREHQTTIVASHVGSRSLDQGVCAVLASSILLVPVNVDPAELTATESVLASQRMRYIVPRRFEDAFRTIAADPPALAIVQAGPMQPALLEVVRRLYSFRVPTLVLLRQLTDQQEAQLLDGGALDVVGLPASTQRLRARVLAMQRYATMNPARQVDEEEYTIGDLTIDVGRREVSVGGAPLSVTKTEFDLLLALARQPRKVLTREELALQALSGKNSGSHALESHLSRLRGKILSAQGPRLFESIRGVGYRLGA